MKNQKNIESDILRRNKRNPKNQYRSNEYAQIYFWNYEL